MYKVVKYNPEKHHRRSLRLKGFDYSRSGMYFITICCQDHEHRFGYIENQIMVLNQFGIITQNEWYKLPDRFQNLQLGAFQVMPNHIHAIVILNGPIAGAILAVAPDANVGAGASPAPTKVLIANPTVGNIIGAYKSLVANECLKLFKSKNEKMGKLWQRNYYERIIRDDRAFNAISMYILNNPAKWKGDKSF